MEKKQVQEKTKQPYKPHLLWQAALLIIAILIVVLVRPTVKIVDETKKEMSVRFDLTKDDIFSVGDFSSSEVSIMGIKFGDSLEKVIETIGYPDMQRVEQNGLVSVEYGSSLDLPDTGLIMQFRENKLVKVTVKDAFNNFLIGKTKIMHSKEAIYGMFGSPEKVEFVPLSAQGSSVFRVMHYPEYPMDIIIYKGQENGFSLYV